MINKLGALSEIASQATHETRKIISFQPLNGADKVRFFIVGQQILYSPRLNLFEEYLAQYLSGEATILIEPFTEEPENVLGINFRMLLWASIRQISPLIHLPASPETYFVKLKNKQLRQIAEAPRNQTDLIAFVFFTQKEKRLSELIRDYPTFPETGLIRSVLHLVTLGYLSISEKPEFSAIEISTPNSDSFKEKKNDQVSGLRKILEMVKKLQ